MCAYSLCTGLYRSVAREDMLRFIISLSEQGTQVIKEMSKEVGLYRSPQLHVVVRHVCHFIATHCSGKTAL